MASNQDYCLIEISSLMNTLYYKLMKVSSILQVLLVALCSSDELVSVSHFVFGLDIE